MKIELKKIRKVVLLAVILSLSLSTKAQNEESLILEETDVTGTSENQLNKENKLKIVIQENIQEFFLDKEKVKKEIENEKFRKVIINDDNGVILNSDGELSEKFIEDNILTLVNSYEFIIPTNYKEYLVITGNNTRDYIIDNMKSLEIKGNQYYIWINYFKKEENTLIINIKNIYNQKYLDEIKILK